MITFLVAVITVSIALLIAVWILATNADTEELKIKFSFAKDVLGTLVGILGTILGFYFGSAEKVAPEQLVLADFQFRNHQVITHATGGTAPYRYTIQLGESDAKAAKVSKDGWIFEPVPPAIKVGSTVNVDITDAKDRKISRTTKYQPEDQEATATPPSSAQQQPPSPIPPSATQPAAGPVR